MLAKTHGMKNGPEMQKPHQRDVLNAAGGEAKRTELDLHPRPINRETTRETDGRGKNMLHGVNIAADQNCVKPKAPDRTIEKGRRAGRVRPSQ